MNAVVLIWWQSFILLTGYGSTISLSNYDTGAPLVWIWRVRWNLSFFGEGCSNLSIILLTKINAILLISWLSFISLTGYGSNISLSNYDIVGASFEQVPWVSIRVSNYFWWWVALVTIRCRSILNLLLSLSLSPISTLQRRRRKPCTRGISRLLPML